jgi:hypothetical protein
LLFSREKETCVFSFGDVGHIPKEHAAEFFWCQGSLGPLIREVAKMCLSSPNLEDIKKEARNLLRGLQRGDAAALSRYHSIDSLDGLSQPRLDDAQFIVAREYGYSSWQKLNEHLRATSGSRNC